MEDVIIADTPVKTVEELTSALAKAEAKIVSLKTEAKEPAPVVVEPVIEEEPVVVEEPAIVAPTEAPVPAPIVTPDEAANNVATTNMMGLNGTAAPVEPSVYSISALEKMTQAEYNKAKDRITS